MRIYSIDSKVEEIYLRDVNFNLNCFFWFDLSLNELEKLNGELFHFNYDSIEECRNTNQMPRVDFYDEYTFLVLNSLKYENGIVDSDEFNVFIGKKCIVTVAKADVCILCDLENDILYNSNTVYFSNEKSTFRMLYYVLDRLIQKDYEIINNLENVADALEISMMKNPDKQFLTALLHLRHQVHTLRRCIAPLRYIGDNILCNENSLIDTKGIKGFEQINLKIEKLIFSLESLVQYIVLVREAYEAQISNKTNELMKLFTIFAMFFSPLNLITGIYGMNFNIPECGWENGYLYSIGLMLVVSVFLFIYFKKKKWL